MKPHKHAELIKAWVDRFVYYPDTGLLFWSNSCKNKYRGAEVTGSIDSHGYRQVKVEGKSVLVHRICFALHYGFIPEQVDHKDRNRLNNKAENLKSATNTTNQWNSGIRKDNTSGCKGVTYKKEFNKWCARISKNKKRCHLGYFETKEAACMAYKKAKGVHHVTD